MTDNAQDEQFLSIDEFARRTSLSESTIRRRVRDGSIPSWQPGGPGTRVLIPIDALDITPPTSTSVAVASPHRVPSRSGSAKIPGPTPKWKAR